MKKGKAKRAQKRYLSIVLVPHSSSRVKVLRFNLFYTKLAAFLAILIAVFVSGGLYISKLLDENKVLRENVITLYSTTAEQNALLQKKSEEIETLRKESAAFREVVNDRIEEFTEKFNQLADEYLEERSLDLKASRSGERTEAAFVSDMRSLKESLDRLSVLYSRSRLPDADLDAVEEKINALMEVIPTLWPVEGRITDGFGHRRDPFTKKKSFHNGLDIAADAGTPIKASASGKVIYADYTYATGRTVKIDHGNGFVTVYGHCSRILVEPGQQVKKGDVIAKVGSTGRSTGPHCHFEVHLYGTAIDPMEYLEKK
ncbi:MAG TPA: peptidoglycan DD-metalloendopeptidase family protein [Clostridiales bacterium]|nr:peptidoglycan DD-metalloendopeptidase family protein [Clostridiales bacterium]HPV02757.1 peptidoglycan DD-metalloendopeptidase family protein [Clostridiales bacterium]